MILILCEKLKLFLENYVLKLVKYNIVSCEFHQNVCVEKLLKTFYRALIRSYYFLFCFFCFCLNKSY